MRSPWFVAGAVLVGKTPSFVLCWGRDFPASGSGRNPRRTDSWPSCAPTTKIEWYRATRWPCATTSRLPGYKGSGNAFLEKLQAPSVRLSHPRQRDARGHAGGVVGAKQRLGRDYDFPQVVRWFAVERSDMIVVMFDAHKLDISDELKATVRGSVL